MFWAVLLLSGCFPGQKIADNYVEQGPEQNFIILAPDFIYKENLKTYLVDSIEDLTDEQRDSILFFSSQYLKDINDSAYLSHFMGSFIDNINKMGMNAYGEDQLDSVMAEGTRAYVINIAQILMEEYITPYEDEAVLFSEVITSGEVDINALSISTWLEMNGMNMPEEDALSKVFFASDAVTDMIDGRFVHYLMSGMVYEFSVDTMKVEDIYGAGEILGYKYAMYLYDYFLNRHLNKEYPSLLEDGFYYHYDPERRKAYPILEGFRFIELDEN